VKDGTKDKKQERKGEVMSRKEIIQALLESPFFLDLNAWEKLETVLAVERACHHWRDLFQDE
jgi:hypothetical protein